VNAQRRSFVPQLVPCANERIPDPAVGRMRGVLDLDPVAALAGGIGAVEPLRDNAFKAHVADDAEQNVANVRFKITACNFGAPLLVLCNEDAVDGAREELREASVLVQKFLGIRRVV
jgi:hypothetical protein